MTVDVGDSSRWVLKPGDVYVTTDRLKELFLGIVGVRLVDDAYSCLRGEDVRELLEACGSVRYLRPIEDSSLPWEERSKLRIQAGHAETSYQKDRITDWMLSGLEKLLETLPHLTKEQRATKAKLLWEELAHLEERRGIGVFTGEYTWTHYGSYRATFDAAFVRKLNASHWVPDDEGQLQRPEFILFEKLGWKSNPFLESKIQFKPPLIETLAREAGIEPGVLDLLKNLGLTSEAELRDRLGLKDDPASGTVDSSGNVTDALKKLLGNIPGPTPPVPDPADATPSGPAPGAERAGPTGPGAGSGKAGTSGDGDGGWQPRGAAAGPSGPSRGTTGTRPFISYVGTHPEDEEGDPDGLDQAARMALEEKAIVLILRDEPQWHRTAIRNPGFDLFEVDKHGRPKCWCEVKAMTASLTDRPVGLSHTQFKCAQEHGESYWLYVVEHAGDDSARIVRIQNPAEKARTFTFDRGWLSVAEVEVTQEDRED